MSEATEREEALLAEARGTELYAKFQEAFKAYEVFYDLANSATEIYREFYDLSGYLFLKGLTAKDVVFNWSTPYETEEIRLSIEFLFMTEEQRQEYADVRIQLKKEAAEEREKWAKEQEKRSAERLEKDERAVLRRLAEKYPDEVI